MSELTLLETSLPLILDQDKRGIKTIANSIEFALANGGLDPTKTLLFSKKTIELFGHIEKSSRKYSDLKLSGNEVYKAFGCEVSEKMTGVKYDFSVCDDKVWDDLTVQIDALTAERKKREEFLKTIPQPRSDEKGNKTNPIFDENGLELRPPLKSGTLGLNVTIK